MILNMGNVIASIDISLMRSKPMKRAGDVSKHLFGNGTKGRLQEPSARSPGAEIWMQPAISTEKRISSSVPQFSPVFAHFHEFEAGICNAVIDAGLMKAKSSVLAGVVGKGHFRNMYRTMTTKAIRLGSGRIAMEVAHSG
jgi:hypothetical protein